MAGKIRAVKIEAHPGYLPPEESTHCVVSRDPSDPVFRGGGVLEYCRFALRQVEEESLLLRVARVSGSRRGTIDSGTLGNISGEARGVDACWIPGREACPIVDSITILCKLTREVAPAHDIARVVVTVHAKDQPAGDEVCLIGGDNCTVVRISFGLSLSPCHPWISAPQTEVPHGFAREMRFLEAPEGWIGMAFDDKFDRGSLGLDKRVATAWVFLYGAAQVSGLAEVLIVNIFQQTQVFLPLPDLRPGRCRLRAKWNRPLSRTITYLSVRSRPAFNTSAALALASSSSRKNRT